MYSCSMPNPHVVRSVALDGGPQRRAGVGGVGLAVGVDDLGEDELVMLPADGIGADEDGLETEV